MASVFSYLNPGTPNKSMITDRELEQLLDKAANTWARVLAAAMLQDRLDKRRFEKVNHEIRAALRPTLSKEFLALVSDLDHKRFQVREATTKKLASGDEAVERMILESLGKPQATEVDQRLRRALKEMHARELPLVSTQVLEQLRFIPAQIRWNS